MLNKFFLPNREGNLSDKISEMLLKVGADFIQLGETIESRENNLRLVASAWNMACHEKSLREKHIKDAISVYSKLNKSDKSKAKAYESNLRQLIKQKIALFPFEKVQIVNVRISQENGQEKVWVSSIKM